METTSLVPRPITKKLVGHEIKVIGLKGDNVVIFDLDGKKGQTYKKNLEKWIEEDLVENADDALWEDPE